MVNNLSYIVIEKLNINNFQMWKKNLDYKIFDEERLLEIHN
jgi:hypothetical protein